MPQSDRSMVASYANAPRAHGSSNMHGSPDMEAPAADLVRPAVERLSRTLEHGASFDSTAGMRRPDADGATFSTFTGRGQGVDKLSRIVALPERPAYRPPGPTLHALQEWEGYVVEKGETEFAARLVDLTAGDSYEKDEAVVPLAEISHYDAARMRVGSIFRWVIGYERSTAGTKKRVSQIVFRDLPAVTETDLRDGEAWARETIRSFES